MNVGLVALSAAFDPATSVDVVRAAERCGFHTFWVPEHVVLMDAAASRYPYGDGAGLPSSLEIPDPFVTLGFLAARTDRIRLGTGICILPQRNPLVVAKEVATLDRLSGGRFECGVGIGWLAEEFAALGVPWARRSARTLEYVRAMRVLWSEDEASFAGEFVRFEKVRSNPKPAQKPHPPVHFGGESDAALRRAIAAGDGWFGFKLTPEQAGPRIARLHEAARQQGRPPLRISVGPGLGIVPDRALLERYRDAGVDELVLGLFFGPDADAVREVESTARAVDEARRL